METRAQVILHTADNLAANYVTNSWCFKTAAVPGPLEYADFTAAFKAFYDSLAGILSVVVAQNGHEIKYYDLEWAIPPNYPTAIETFNLTSTPSAATLPTEVACCISMQGQKLPGLPQRRRRGRVYIGPLSTTTNSLGRPSAGLQAQLKTSVLALKTALLACDEPGTLAVWSEVDGAAVPVTDGWIDDAYDTQRRRGVQKTSRLLWP
jgi:hypothetical protein